MRGARHGARAPAAGSVVGLTCTADRLEHLVGSVELTVGLASGYGRFRARCGHVVVAASLATAPGRRCRSCTERHEHFPDSEPRPPRRRITPFNLNGHLR